MGWVGLTLQPFKRSAKAGSATSPYPMGEPLLFDAAALLAELHRPEQIEEHLPTTSETRLQRLSRGNELLFLLQRQIAKVISGLDFVVKRR
jgi:hypothetical protein